MVGTMPEPYYITTAISYPNGRPHIGHAYEAIAADVVARFQKMRGREVRFQTGTDEHGLKMARKAEENGIPVRALADEMSSYFKGMCDALNVEYDRFIRTTDSDHHNASQALWKAMEANGDLYLDRYEGWYSIRDEAFYDEKELIVGEGDVKLSPQGTAVEWTAEESWFFRLSKYQDRLLDLYRANPAFLQPDSRRNEMAAFVEGGLRDLSISRTSFDWGVPVPGGGGHVMYVWVDALTNYLTGLGYPNETGDMAKYWPANLHLIGKDIVRFHAVYWPAFLMSAGLPVPETIFGHGFILNRGQKELKSEGNVTDPLAMADRFGVDNLRYFLMREVVFGQDGSYSPDAIVTCANAELANSFGNLAQRTLAMIHKNMEGALHACEPNDKDRDLLASIADLTTRQLPDAFEKLQFSVGIEAWRQAVFACNQYVDEQAPWALRKDDPDRMRTVLMVLFQCLTPLAVAIRPVVPRSADAMLDQLGIEPGERDFAMLARNEWFGDLVGQGFVIGKPVGVFPRLDMPEKEAA